MLRLSKNRRNPNMSVRYVNFQLGEGATTPYKKYNGDAGWDLFTSQACDIAPGETVDVHTNVKIDMPPYLYARITGRSSSLRKYNLLINEGIIDNGYTGELFVCVKNLGHEVFHVKQGMRLAQILFHLIEDVRWCEVPEIQAPNGRRGENGFGSTGA
jgi:dUTP pyrophosphatase